MAIEDYGLDFISASFDSATEGIKVYVAIYLVLLLAFWLMKDDERKKYFVYPAIFMALTIYNPYLMNRVAEVIRLESRFRRMFWLLPVNIVLGYAVVRAVGRLGRIWKKVICLALCIFLLAVSGSSAWSAVHPSENIYKIADEKIDLVDAINEDAKNQNLQESEKMALYADATLLELRQYDPSIQNIISRSEMLSWNPKNLEPETVQKIIDSGNEKKILTLVARFGVQVDLDVFRTVINNEGVHYIVVLSTTNLREYFQNAGYPVLLETDNYILYKVQ